MLALVVCGLVVAGVAAAAEVRTIEGGGVSGACPGRLGRVPRAEAGLVGEPRTLLVVGTRGVRPIETDCRVASYKIPIDGAAVVVIGWRGKLATHRRSRHLLARELERDYFECFSGRALAAQFDLDGRTYQVNVMVGDRAEKATIAEAIAVARSVALSD